MSGFEPTDAAMLRSVFLVKRNACFGAVYYDEQEHVYYALTDHLGNVPICYTLFSDKHPEFSHNPLQMLGGTVDGSNLTKYLATGTLKFSSDADKGVVPAGTILVFLKKDARWVVQEYERYTWQQQQRSLCKSISSVTKKLDELLEQATRRLIPNTCSRVSLALSSGGDSAVTAYYLQRAGVTVDAFTVSPWGASGVEATGSRATAKRLGIATHTIFNLETEQYQKYLTQYTDSYPYPNGTVASLTISALWRNTEIEKNGVVFFAQNADTLFGSVIHQFSTFFYMLIPLWLRRLIHVPYFKPMWSGLKNYSSLVTLGNTKWWPSEIPSIYTRTSLFTQLTFAGMLWGHTPSDGEVFIMPAIQKGISIANIFYDVDVIEYVLSIPLWQRIGYSKESRIRIAIKKLPLLRLIKTKKIIDSYQKKGLVLPKSRDVHTQAFFESLPKTFDGVTLKGENHKFALRILDMYRASKE